MKKRRSKKPKRYILDTNILVHAIRGDATWQEIRAQYDLMMHEPRSYISVVSEGEVRSLSRQWGWGEPRRIQMNFVVGYFDRVTIDDPNILETYALIDAHSESLGFTMGKNDLWIAATANIFGATLLTTDSDFDHLAPIYLNLERIEPAKVNPLAAPKITP